MFLGHSSQIKLLRWRLVYLTHTLETQSCQIPFPSLLWPIYQVRTSAIISFTAAFAINLKLATSVCLFVINETIQGSERKCNLTAEVYSSGQAISLGIWGLFTRYLFSITTGSWSHQYLYAHSQHLTFSETTTSHWSLIWRICYLPAHTYHGAWNQTSKMQTCKATGPLVNKG